ncbi:protoporphyrinogen/coproporphyrinogen oxidase [Acidipropionibacterium timonense]|uniref:protoporphyrinogen/coproporphyrinogen oxidase n=1 Tax=Acidipropionibacterium timonense TaxID=2161818 RepID=UPI002477E4A8|nr:FAD-dependent oxidoreductase [Acidipropionibacterium timonense]
MTSPHALTAPTSTEVVDAVVIGAGMSGLVAAWQLTRAGLRPVVLESRGYTGGLVAGATLAGVAYDIGAEGWATRLPDTDALAAELRLAVEHPRPHPSWVWFDDATFALPHRAILGVPADPRDADVVAAIGAPAAERAMALDAVPLPAELPEDLGGLVESRLGTAVLSRLVRPIAGGIHAAEPRLLSADVVAPGLRQAAQRAGSLHGGVADLLARRTQAAVVASVEGGMFRMPQALHEGIVEAGGRVLTRTGARSLRRVEGQGGEAGWVVEAAATSRNPDPSLPPIADGAPLTLRTPRVIVACSAAPALDLLAGVVDVTGPQLTPGAPIAHVNLAVRAPELDVAPRGGGMLVAQGSTRVAAKALTHLSAKWPSLGRACPAGLHLLRVSYGRTGEQEAGLSVEQALVDASTLLGIDLAAGRLVDSAIIHWTGALAPTTPHTRAWVEDLHARLAQLPGIRLTGAWASGSGIAALVPHARSAARAVC